MKDGNKVVWRHPLMVAFAELQRVEAANMASAANNKSPAISDRGS
jgi:hypothetical protein